MRTKGCSLLLILSLFLVPSLFAQSTDTKTAEEQRTVFDIRSEGGNKYLKILHELESFEPEDRMQQAMRQAVMASVASFMAPNAVYDSLLHTQRFRFRSDSLRDKINERGIFGIDTLAKTLGPVIEDEKLVMFSEHHYYPNHRMIVDKLLPLFNKAGFRYLAMEALSHSDDSLLSAGHPPTIHSGFYTMDPRFANLIRRAQDLGFTFVAYENMQGDVDREVGQAANLVKATFEQDPDAKVLVLAGMAHILEKPTRRGKKWMGAVLHETYGINPLTINQHSLSYFHSLTEDVALVQSTAFSDPLLNSVDYHLINNLSLLPNDMNYDFENTYQQRIQLSVYLSGELSSSVDADSLIPIRSRMIEAGESISLSLPDEDLQFSVYDISGKLLENGSIKRSH